MRRLSESPVVQAPAKSYVDAPRKDKASVLSTIANHFSRTALNMYVFAPLGVTISKFILRTAREHAGPRRPKDIRNHLDSDELSFCYSIILPHVDEHSVLDSYSSYSCYLHRTTIHVSHS